MSVKTQPAAPVSRPPRQHSGLSMADLPWKKIATFALVVAAITLLLYKGVGPERIHEEADKLNGFAAFALLVVLPLFGFPASLLHIAAGIRFGAPLGLALVSLSILIQLFASYGIVTLWRPRFERSRWLKQIRERIPQGAHASVAIFTVLLPGAPFSAVNFVLPLIGVPLRTFILCAWPLHTLRSTITVALGDQSDRLSATRLAVLVVYALLVFGASAWTYRRLRSQLSDQPPAAGDRKPRG